MPEFHALELQAKQHPLYLSTSSKKHCSCIMYKALRLHIDIGLPISAQKIKTFSCNYENELFTAD